VPNEKLLAAVFASGFLMEGALLLGGSKWDFEGVGLPTAGSLIAGVGVFGFGLIVGADAVGTALTASVLFGMFFAFANFHNALTPLSEAVVLCDTVVLWGSVTLARNWDWFGWQALVLGCGSALALFCLAPRVRLSTPLKSLLYVWHLLVVVWVGFGEFRYGDLDFFSGFDPWTLPHYPHPARLLLAGMGLMYLTVNAGFLALGLLLPIAQADQGTDASESARAFAQSFSSERPSLGLALAIVALQAAAFPLDRAFRWGAGAALVNASFAVVPVVLGYAARPARR